MLDSYFITALLIIGNKKVIQFPVGLNNVYQLMVGERWLESYWIVKINCYSCLL